jgi:hypothetical protein
MRSHNPRLLAAVAAGAGVLLLAVTLFRSYGVIDALVMVLVVAVLAGMYRLRRYARAELLYRHRGELRRSTPDTESEPLGHRPTQDRRVTDRV